MSDTPATPATPKFLNKYNDRASLDAGVGELAKELGVPVGAFANDDDAVKAYTSLSDLRRRLGEKKEPPPRTVFDPATLPDDEDDTTESINPVDLMKEAGIDSAHIEAMWEKEQKLPGPAYAKIRKALIKGLESKSARSLVDAFIDAQVKGVKGERADLNTQAMKITGLSQKGLDRLLAERAKYVPEELLGELNSMLSVPLSQKGKAVVAIDSIHKYAVAKGFKEEVDAAAGSVVEPVSGGTPSGNVPGKKRTPAETRELWNKASNGDKAAQRELANA